MHVIAEVLRFAIPALSAMCAQGGSIPDSLILPSDRHCLLRVIPVCITLLGSGTEGKAKELRDIFLDKGSLGKDLQLQKLLKEAVELMKSNPVGPLFGDMPNVVHSVLHDAPWYHQVSDTYMSGFTNPPSMSDSEAAALCRRYDLREHLFALRRQYAANLSRFLQVTADLDASGVGSAGAWRPDLLQEGYTAILDACKTLSAMSSLILEQAAWKASRPAKDTCGPQGAESSEQGREEELVHRYDLMVKLNYTPGEMDALLEVLHMSVGLTGALRARRSTLVSLIKRYTHWDTQTLLQERLTGMISHASKNKKKEQLDLLIILRQVGLTLAC